MKSCYLAILYILSFYLTVNSQQIKITTKNLDKHKVTLYSLFGEKTKFIDSSFAEKSGLLNCKLEHLSTGFYQFRINGSSPVTFIYSGEDIELKVDTDNIDETVEVVKSESNKIYYEFVQLNNEYKTKTELLRLILARYPQNDNYFQTTVEKVNQLQKQYAAFVDSVVSIDPSLFIAQYIKSSQLPIVDHTLPIEEQITYLKSHALDNVNFNNAELINSDCFTNKSIEYLTYYRNPQLPKELLEQEFQKAVDTLLTKASVNILVYQHIADYLIDGFKQFGFDNVVDCIVENYVVKDDLCLDERTENSIKNRINQSRLLKIGTTAPNIILPDTAGKLIDISEIDKQKILLLFYTSWCPHCQEMLPEIYKLYKHRNDIEVVAVSLDVDREAWVDFIKNNGFDWINVSDLKGWDSKAAQDYFIYATPTMFLLDNKKIILGKDVTTKKLINIL